MSAFPWLDPNLGGRQGARRLDAALRELRDRAGVYYRLGFTREAASARLAAAVAWEFEHARPTQLSDVAIAALVGETYARRPA